MFKKFLRRDWPKKEPNDSRIILSKWSSRKKKMGAWLRLVEIEKEDPSKVIYSYMNIVSHGRGLAQISAAVRINDLSKESTDDPFIVMALATIVRFGPEVFRETAWRRLVALAKYENTFWHIIYYGGKEVPQTWRERVRDHIMRQRPDLKKEDFAEWVPIK